MSTLTLAVGLFLWYNKVYIGFLCGDFMDVKNMYYRFLHKIYKFKFFVAKHFTHRDWKVALNKNKALEGIHNGKRCFILGNGPSLKTEDLKLLENEFVFSVNQIARHEDFEYIKPNYHFWADPNFFNIDESKPEDLELLEIMKKVNTSDNIPRCFFPIEQKNFVEKFGLDKTLDVNYFASAMFFYEGYNGKIDYTDFVLGFGTVVQWCITMAIYMGFSEIYLLGCDNTGLLTTIKAILKMNDETDYAYNITENEKKRMELLHSTQPLEQVVNSYLETLKGYRYVFEYCKKRSIKLVNCSSTTVIDSIPRDSLQNVLKK